MSADLDLIREAVHSDRFWSKVQKTDTCWLWIAARNKGGYGQFGIKRRTVLAHRIAYTALVGPIPHGLQLDHLCRVRRCVNPAHLEPVTQNENVRRGAAALTHCPAGHPYDEVNTRHSPGGRRCRACDRDRYLAARAARRRPVECPVCAKTMQLKWAAQHCRRAHGMSREQSLATSDALAVARAFLKEDADV